MAQDELPQTYLITPSDFDQTVLCDDLARVLDAHPVACVRMAMATGDETRLSKAGDILREVEPEDLLRFGLIPEFVGRLPVIATLEDLDEDALVTILTQPKNALVKQYQRLFELENVKLTFTDDALTAIAKRAIERKTGARGLRTILENVLLDTMYDLPSSESAKKVVVDEAVVTGENQPYVIYESDESPTVNIEQPPRPTGSDGA